MSMCKFFKNKVKLKIKAYPILNRLPDLVSRVRFRFSNKSDP